MLSLEKILDRKKEASGFVSSQTRTLALGFLGISWALLTAHDDALRAMASHVNRYLLLALALSGVLVITSDLLQYVAVTSMADAAALKAEHAIPPQGQYERNSLAWRAQAALYRLKFIFLVVGAILLAIIFFHLFRAIA